MGGVIPKRPVQQKDPRTKDAEFLAAIRKLNCMACGAAAPSEAHHVRSRGAYGGDDAWNILPLCSAHHTMGKDAWHRIGPLIFLRKFPHVREYLETMGWVYDGRRLYRPATESADGP